MLQEDPLQLPELPSSSFSDPPLEQQQAPTTRKQLPNKITTAKHGPLVLQTPREVAGRPSTLSFHGASLWGQAPPPSHRRRLYAKQPLPKRRSLTRFIVPDVQRPIDKIQENLGEVSCAELTETVQLIGSWRPSPRTVAIPHSFHATMQYPHHPPPSLPTTEHYTHTDQGPLGISITYSRHLDQGIRPDPAHYPPPHPSWRNYTPLTPNYMYPMQQWTHMYPLPANSCGANWTTSSAYPVISASRPNTKPPTSQLSHPTTNNSTAATSQRMSASNLRPVSMVTAARPSIAPSGVRAVAIHRLKPLTASTVVRGKQIHTLQ